MRLNVSVRARLGLLAAMTVSLFLSSGCGGPSEPTGVVPAAQDHAKRNQEMLDFMKTQTKDVKKSK
jgi:hypothetical protein